MQHIILLCFCLMWLKLFSQKTPPAPYPSSINRANEKLYPVYKGTDLGCNWTPGATTIKIWAPSMQQVKLYVYDAGLEGNRLGEYDMKKGAMGVWQYMLPGNQTGRFYTIQVFNGATWSEEVTDPYSRAVGANGKRSAIIDLKQTHPAGWSADRSPGNYSRKCDAVIYELHVRDATIHVSSGVQDEYRGKFLGLAQTGTRNAAAETTGLDHIKELGVTHVQLLPFYDFFTVDETQPEKPQYNWGYDPLHYNVPEGSYSTNPHDPAVRIRELKQMIHTFHKNGLRVIMDVVYNHTMLGPKSNFNILVPDYYYRTKTDGSFSDASACGNETASDAPMFRKFMLESLEYWVKEYHIDGFRFDLMAIHDIETMNLISKRLQAIKPDILLHGEGWTAGGSPLAEEKRAVKRLAHQLNGIGVFSDEIRDAMKGGWSNEKDNGFVSGKPGMEESIKYGIAGAVKHPQVDYSKVNYSKQPFAKEPWQCIVYNECHDNHTLWDRLVNSAGNFSEKQRMQMYKLAQTIVLTSQGIPFIHAGQEMYRTKQGIDNSYNKPDSINQIDWARKTAHFEMMDFTKKLIALRKKYPEFRLNNATEVAARLKFYHTNAEHVIGYTITGKTGMKLLVLLNGGTTAAKATLPGGRWLAQLYNNSFDVNADEGPASLDVELSAFGAAVFVQIK